MTVAVDGRRRLVAVVVTGGGVQSIAADPEAVAVSLQVVLIIYLRATYPSAAGRVS